LKAYLASGWFSPEWNEEVTQIRDTILNAGFEAFVPRDFFICPPDAPEDVQQKTYDGNLEHLDSCEFMVCNTRNKDMGTIFEAGFFSALDKPIIYFCQGLPAGAKFNLMLARSGVKVCTTFEELEDYLVRSRELGEFIVEPYGGNIE
jgi:nucleoside 2-deoxyribosyltransferase